MWFIFAVLHLFPLQFRQRHLKFGVIIALFFVFNHDCNSSLNFLHELVNTKCVTIYHSQLSTKECPESAIILMFIIFQIFVVGLVIFSFLKILCRKDSHKSFFNFSQVYDFMIIVFSLEMSPESTRNIDMKSLLQLININNTFYKLIFIQQFSLLYNRI